MADSSSERVAETRKHSAPVDFLVRLVKEKPLGFVGAIITLLLLLAGIFAEFIAPYGVNETNIAEALTAPSARFWLGTDSVGRDVLSRIIYGARISVIVGLGGAAICTVIALAIGMLSGYIGGKFDLIVQRVVDGFMCFPGLILLIVVISIVGADMYSIIVILGVSQGIASSRVLRSAVMSIKENVYVTAAVSIGCSTPRILIRHILPNIMAPTIIVFSTRLPVVVLIEASLSFLGFGIPPPAPSWGGMMSGAGLLYMFQAPWMVTWPGLALASVVYGVNMFGDAVRDLLDPKLRGGIGRYGMRAKKADIKK